MTMAGESVNKRLKKNITEGQTESGIYVLPSLCLENLIIHKSLGRILKTVLFNR